MLKTIAGWGIFICVIATLWGEAYYGIIGIIMIMLLYAGLKGYLHDKGGDE